MKAVRRGLDSTVAPADPGVQTPSDPGDGYEKYLGNYFYTTQHRRILNYVVSSCEIYFPGRLHMIAYAKLVYHNTKFPRQDFITL